MDIAASVGLGIALAVDASAVAFSCGISARDHTPSCPLKLALVTGAFQGLMPTTGFFAADGFVRCVGAWSHWIAFGVFLALGVVCLRNAWTEEEKKGGGGCARCAIASWKSIFAVGVATSLDALAVGAGIACAAPSGNAESTLCGTIFVPAAVIAGTTFVCVLSAFYATRFFRRLPTKFLGTLAGLILIALGVNAVF